MNPKIKTTSQIKALTAKLKKQGRKIVFTNGCFDILHAGHIDLLKRSKALGDVLILGINADSSVKSIKGKKRPIIPEKYRMELMSAVQYIDFVVKFSEDTPLNLIKAIRPDILVKGDDWAPDQVVGREYAGKVVLVPLFKGWSTTSIIQKIKENY